MMLCSTKSKGVESGAKFGARSAKRTDLVGENTSLLLMLESILIMSHLDVVDIPWECMYNF